MAIVKTMDDEFKSNDEAVNQLFKEQLAIRDKLCEHLIGRKYRVLSNFNGQLYGSSKKPLTGKVFEIKLIAVDSGGISVWDGDYNHCYIDLSEVELLDDNETEQTSI